VRAVDDGAGPRRPVTREPAVHAMSAAWMEQPTAGSR
jgi:hypothetical protein